MTVPQAKGLEFDDVFLFNFFHDSPADASEWRVLNGFVEELKQQVEDSREGGKVRVASITQGATLRCMCADTNVEDSIVRLDVCLCPQDLKVFEGNLDLLERFKTGCVKAHENLNRAEAGYLRRAE